MDLVRTIMAALKDKMRYIGKKSRGDGGRVCPAAFYNHKSGTFLKNKRKGL